MVAMNLKGFSGFFFIATFLIFAFLSNYSFASYLSVQESAFRTAWLGKNTTAMCSPMHVVWARGVDLLASTEKAAKEMKRMPKRNSTEYIRDIDALGISVPPFPRNAAANPMHALLDHIFAVATLAENCALGAHQKAKTRRGVVFIIHGMSRKQIISHENSTKLRPNFPDVDLLNGPPTWGQWVLYMYAVQRVGKEKVVFAEDLQEPVRFAEGVLCFQFDYLGLHYRELRMEYVGDKRRDAELPQYGPLKDEIISIPRPEIPEEWKRRGLSQVRKSVLEHLNIQSENIIVQRKSSTTNILLHTRMGSKRRRWRNYEDTIKAIQARFGKNMVNINVHHGYGEEHEKVSDLTFKDQVAIHSMSHILIAPHGAGVANAAFMGEGAHLVEIWKCCFENPIVSRKPGPWTGWLISRLGLGMTVSYIPCKALNSQFESLQEIDRNATGCDGANSRYLHPPYIEVNPSLVILAIERFLDNSIDERERDIYQASSKVNWTRLHQIRESVSPKHIHSKMNINRDRLATIPTPVLQWAPVGPSWTSRANSSPKDNESEAAWLRQRAAEANLEKQYWEKHSQWAEMSVLGSHQGKMVVEYPPRPPLALYNRRTGKIVLNDVSNGRRQVQAARRELRSIWNIARAFHALVAIGITMGLVKLAKDPKLALVVGN